MYHLASSTKCATYYPFRDEEMLDQNAESNCWVEMPSHWDEKAENEDRIENT